MNRDPKQLQQPEWRALLVEARDALEENARHVFVVCGQPTDRDEFNEAWRKGDPATYHLAERIDQLVCRTVPQPMFYLDAAELAGSPA